MIVRDVPTRIPKQLPDSTMRHFKLQLGIWGQGYQAILDLNAHHAVCPMGDDVYIQLGSGTVARE